MNKSHLSLIVAAMMAAGAAQAQTAPAAGNSDGPPKAGEASNRTMGVPNAQTTNSPVTEAPVHSRDQVRMDAQGRSSASATLATPGKAGEATTMVQGNPNVDPNAVIKPSRADVMSEVTTRRARLDAWRSASIMGGPPATVQGGTPK